MVELRKQNFHTWLWRLSSTNVANAFLHSPRPLQDVLQSFSSLSASRKGGKLTLITNYDPRDAMVAVVGTDGGNGTELAGNLVEDGVGLAGVGVDGTDQAVLRDVLEVATARVSKL